MGRGCGSPAFYAIRRIETSGSRQKTPELGAHLRCCCRSCVRGRRLEDLETSCREKRCNKNVKVFFFAESGLILKYINKTAVYPYIHDVFNPSMGCKHHALPVPACSALACSALPELLTKVAARGYRRKCKAAGDSPRGKKIR